MRHWGVYLLLLAGAAQAADYAGVWKGTLGQQEIVACFNDGNTGSFYTASGLRPKPLFHADKAPDGAWQEGSAYSQASRFWALGEPASEALTGHWREGDKNLPLQLRRVTRGEGEKKACAVDAFDAELLGTLRLAQDAPQQWGRHRYRWTRWMVSDDAMCFDHLEILDDSAGARAFNQQFGKDQPAMKAELDDALGVREFGLTEVGDTQRYLGEHLMEIEFWNAHWLVLRFYTWAAGRGASGIDYWYRTWNLNTGEQVHPWEWFGQHSDWASQSANDAESNRAQPDATLRKRLLAQMPAPAEKDENCYGSNCFSLWPTDAGLMVQNGSGRCSRVYSVPYSRIKKFMTPAARALLPGLEEK
jgi:hypothetical protein